MTVDELDVVTVEQSVAAYTDANFTWLGDTQALVTNHDVGRVVAFRGTELKLEDWKRDLKGFPVHDDTLGWCHAGFLEAALGAWPDLRKLPGDLIFTGHSLGAAIATLCAGFAASEGRRVKALITYGSPRAGFGLLGSLRTVEAKRRWVRGEDAVPGHPWALWGYRHVGPPLPLPGGDGRYDDHDRFGYYREINRLFKER